MQSFLDIIYTFLFVIMGFLIGSINFAIIFSKIFYKQDIRKYGSKNAGATNMRRVYTNSIAVLVALLDMKKSAFALAIGFLFKENLAIFSGIWIAPIGLGAILGHIYPIYFGFKGGKGVSSFFGFLFFAQWFIIPFAFLCFMIIIKKWKIVSVASLLTPVIVLSLTLILGLILDFSGVPMFWWTITFASNSRIDAWWIFWIVLALSYVLVLFKHKENIQRILKKQENKV